jgi:dephospho-CoA kinase
VKRIGLSGGIGSGKSYVAEILEKMGFPVYYSDAQSKALTDTHPHIISELVKRFDATIYEDGVLNRNALASLIFDSEENRLFVNNLIHPIVRADFDAWCAMQDSPFVFNEAAILFETGAYRQFHATVLVIAPFETRLQRIIQRDRCTQEQAEARINSQWSDEQKIPLANAIVSNNGHEAVLIQVEHLTETLKLNNPNSR